MYSDFMGPAGDHGAHQTATNHPLNPTICKDKHPGKQCTNEEQHTINVQRVYGARRRPRSATIRHQSLLDPDDLPAQAAKKVMHQRRAKHHKYPAIFWAAGDHGAHKTANNHP